MAKKEKKDSDAKSDSNAYQGLLGVSQQDSSISSKDMQTIEKALEEVDAYDALNRPRPRNRRAEPAEIARRLDLPSSQLDSYAKFIKSTAKNIESDLEYAYRKAKHGLGLESQPQDLSSLVAEAGSKPQTEIDNIIDLKKEIVGDKAAYYAAMQKYSQPDTISKFFSDVGDKIAETKGGLSLFAMKLEASKYGIPPREFDALKNTPGGLRLVQQFIAEQRAKEMELEKSRALAEKTRAERDLAEAYAIQRFAKAQSILGEEHKPRLVQFGFKGFVGEHQPVYLYNPYSHSAVRAKLLLHVDNKPSKIRTQLALMRMRESLLSVPRVSPRPFGKSWRQW